MRARVTGIRGGAASSALAAGNVFTADYSSTLGNWDEEKGSAGRTQARVAGGGPKGLDAFEITMTPNTGNGAYYCGHNIVLSNFAGGVSRFYRWYERHGSSNNYRAFDGGDIVFKRLLLGFGTSTDDRVICNMDGTRDGLPHFEAIFDTFGQAPLTSDDFALNTWLSVQVEVRYGAGAYIKVWLGADNDSYATPTLSSTPEAHSEVDNGWTDFGMLSNDGFASDCTMVIRDAAFRVATTFDDNWDAWLTA